MVLRPEPVPDRGPTKLLEEAREAQAAPDGQLASELAGSSRVREPAIGSVIVDNRAEIREFLTTREREQDSREETTWSTPGSVTPG